MKFHLVRLGALMLLGLVSLQLCVAGRIAMMNWVDPQSTTFQRSEAWRLVVENRPLAWGQQWADDEQIAATLKRAVIASEDSEFVDHGGVDWDALERAWERNQRAQAQADKRNEQLAQRAKSDKAHGPAPVAAPVAAAKVVGGSTITQQLAKNLFLSGERTAARKAEEMIVTYMLEALLPKRRILEIYLNSVEWGEGLFGAQAAARYYFKTDAARLSPYQAARLAVMLPAPKRFERRPGSAYLVGRAQTVIARMAAVELP
jgi:monofunctional glycosyltransferase